MRSTTPDEHSVTRSWLSWLVMSDQPRVLLTDEVADRHAHVFVVRDVRVGAAEVVDRHVRRSPGVSVGTMMIEMPLCFFTSGLVRTASQT